MLHSNAVRTMACALLLSLAACQGGKEDRINAALPPGSDVAAAQDKLLATLKTLDADPKPFEQALDERMHKRAQDCAHDYAPGLFAGEQSIRDGLTDKPCFADHDAAIKRWLEYRRVGVLLAAPPLRPVPASMPRMDIGDRGYNLVFADRAGVALVQVENGYVVLDLANGKALPKVATERGADIAQLTPNGRMFLITREHDAEVRDTLTNDLLLTLPGTPGYKVWWAGDVGAFFHDASDTASQSPSRTITFIDFTSGETTQLPTQTGDFQAVLPMPGTPNRFSILAYNRVLTVDLAQSNGIWQAKVVAERPMDGISWDRGMRISPDGRTAAVAQGNVLRIVSLATMQSETITVSPMRISAALPTPDADNILLYGYLPTSSGGESIYQYSLSQRTLAPVDTKQLLTTHLVWVPLMKRNALLDNRMLAPLDSLPVGLPESMGPLLDRLAQENEALQAQRRAMAAISYDANGQRVPMDSSAYGVAAASAAMAAPMTVKGPLLDIARDADIKAIGVYEGEQAAGARRSHGTGTVNVYVRKTARPVVLVLSAYEPVRWVITLQDGARLAAIAQSGYYPGEVMGAPAAKRFTIGTAYAYSRGGAEYMKLDALVQRWTGKQIGGFQGSYTGKMFVLGL